jgi:hypothetical protein
MVLIPPGVRANRAPIASPDFHPEEDASRTQRVRALALLQGERSLARVLRLGILPEIARSNRPASK